MLSSRDQNLELSQGKIPADIWFSKCKLTVRIVLESGFSSVSLHCILEASGSIYYDKFPANADPVGEGPCFEHCCI